jgi:hypothetical protein
MTCAICGRRIVGLDHLGQWWVWVHADGTRTTDHWPQPVRVARR